MLAQGFDGGELNLVAQFFHKGEFHLLSVKVALEIQQVRLDAQVRRGLSQRGAHSNVEGGAVPSTRDESVRGIHAVRRHEAALGIEIRRGETELAPQSVAGHDRPAEGVFAAQHLRRCGEIPRSNRLAEARAADLLAIQRHGGEAMHGERQLAPELLQERDVATALVTEGEGAAHADAMHGTELFHEGADENVARLRGKFLGEGNHQQRIHTQRGERAHLLRGGVEQGRHAVGRHDAAGMLVEGDGHGHALVLRGVGHGLADDLLMTEVDAIKHADG